MKKAYLFVALLFVVPSDTKTEFSFSTIYDDAAAIIFIAAFAFVSYKILTAKNHPQNPDADVETVTVDDEQESDSEYFDRIAQEREDRRDEREKRKERRKKRRIKLKERKEKRQLKQKKQDRDIAQAAHAIRSSSQEKSEVWTAEEPVDYSREIPENGEGFIDKAVL